MKKNGKKHNRVQGSSYYIQVHIKKPFILVRIINKMFGLQDRNRYIFTKIPPEKVKI